TEKVEAEFENGMLKVTAPKAEEVKPKVVKVKASKK
ncbi:molecular chaperone Hsp20, partial [candidate division WWE3 bacterium CG_4_10_14_0_2_um_filter_42_8]